MENLNKHTKDNKKKYHLIPFKSKTIQIKYIRRNNTQSNTNRIETSNNVFPNASNFYKTFSERNTISNESFSPKNQKSKLNLEITPHKFNNYFFFSDKKDTFTPNLELKKIKNLNNNIPLYTNTLYTQSNKSINKNTRNLTYNKTIKSLSSVPKNVNQKYPSIKCLKQFSYNSILSEFRLETKKILNKSIKKTKKDITDNIKRVYEINKKSKLKKNKLKLNTIPNNLSKGNNTNSNSALKQRQSSELTKNNRESDKKLITDSDDEDEKTVKKKINIYKNHKRRRSFNKYKNEDYIFNLKWKKKLGIFDSEMKYNSILSRGLNFQCNIIKDEMSLLLDNVFYYKLNVLNSSEIKLAFKNKNIKCQESLNKIIEESCALLSLLPKILLKEYYIYSDRFISIPEPGPENYITKIISNESDCFSDNIKLLYKIIIYVKSSYQVYAQLVAKVEDEMILTPHNFNLILTIFQKTRYFIGHLINYTKNILKDYIFDKQLIAKSRPMIKKAEKEFQFYEYDNNEKVTSFESSEEIYNIEKKKSVEKKDNKGYKKITSQVNFRENDVSQKILRINKVLESNNELKDNRNKISEQFRIKQAKLSMKNSRIGPMALIFSPLMTEMMKYIKKDIRGKIISLRTTEKNYISPGEENE